MLSKLSIGQSHVKNAKALIVCIADENAWEEAKITHIKNPALNPALQGENGLLVRTMEQVIYPIAYMMLEAESLGISSCIIGALGNEITQITSPQITTVVQDVPQLTRCCVDLLLRRMAGERTVEEIIVPVDFKRGGTT